MPPRRASTLVGGGILAGAVLGGLLVGIALPRQPPPVQAGQRPATSGPAAIGVSPNAAAALRGTTTLNGRLVAEADPLAAAIVVNPFPVQDVVGILRRMSTDARAAAAMVPSLGEWPEAGAQQAALGSLYEELGAEIDTGLAASVTDASALKSTTTAILGTMRRIVGLDATARTLAAGAGLDLPSIVIPGALR